MSVYVVKRQDSRSNTVRLVHLECAGDNIARAGAAAMMQPGEAAELWCGDRRVGTVACALIVHFARPQGMPRNPWEQRTAA